MKKFLLILLVLAGCGRDDPASENRAAAPESAAPAAGKSKPSSPAAGGETRLTGLYEGGAGAQKSQLCLLEKGRETQFGLVVWGANLHSCSGAGRAVREGERLTLTMTGDETCTIAASLKDGKVTLPATLPLGCAYYCAARASLAGASFSHAGSGEAEAKKAKDVAGDPLCD